MSYVSQEASMNMRARAEQLCHALGIDPHAFVAATDEYGRPTEVPQWAVVAEQLRRHIAMTEMVRDMIL